MSDRLLDYCPAGAYGGMLWEGTLIFCINNYDSTYHFLSIMRMDNSLIINTSAFHKNKKIVRFDFMVTLSPWMLSSHNNIMIKYKQVTFKYK